MTIPLDLTTIAPATLRLLLASCAADPGGPLDIRQKALLWFHLHQHDWFPTPEQVPFPLEPVQAWLDGLQGEVRAFVESIVNEEVPHA